MKRTISELHAMAMLMGPHWRYDANDHTFCDHTDGQKGRVVVWCADTMEYVGTTGFSIDAYDDGKPEYHDRVDKVKRGEYNVEAEDES